MSDWSWEYFTDGYDKGTEPALRTEVERLATQLASVNSMTFLDGPTHAAAGPGVRIALGSIADGRTVMVHYITDVRGERIVITTVSCA